MTKMDKQYIAIDLEKVKRSVARAKSQDTLTKKVAGMFIAADDAKEVASRWGENFADATREDLNDFLGKHEHLNSVYRYCAEMPKRFDAIYDKQIPETFRDRACSVLGIDPKEVVKKGEKLTIGQLGVKYAEKKLGLTKEMLNGSDQDGFEKKIPDPQMREILQLANKGKKPSEILSLKSMSKMATKSLINPKGALHRLLYFVPGAKAGLIAYDTILYPVSTKYILPFIENTVKPFVEDLYSFIINPKKEEINDVHATADEANSSKLDDLTGNHDADRPSKPLEDLIRVCDNGGMSKEMLAGFAKCLEEKEHGVEGRYLDGDADDLNYQEATGYNLCRKLVKSGIPIAVIAALCKSGILDSKRSSDESDELDAASTEDRRGVPTKGTSSVHGNVGSGYAAGSIGDIKQRLKNVTDELIPEAQALIRKVQDLDVQIANIQRVAKGSGKEMMIMEHIIRPLTMARNNIQDAARANLPKVRDLAQQWINRG